MRSSAWIVASATLALGACGQQSNETANAANVQHEANEIVPTAPPAAAPAANQAQPAPASLPEPKGPIDPKSPEAAGQVVQHYGALIERGHWLKAEKLWSDVPAARTFATALGRQFERVHLEIGKPGEPEGAAGSIYLTVPVVFYGEDKTSNDLRRPADIILRRVNDVPGSTDKQRRWNIERIEWKAGPKGR